MLKQKKPDKWMLMQYIISLPNTYIHLCKLSIREQSTTSKQKKQCALRVKDKFKQFKTNLRLSTGDMDELQAFPAHTVWPEQAYSPRVRWMHRCIQSTTRRTHRSRCTHLHMDALLHPNIHIVTPQAEHDVKIAVVTLRPRVVLAQDSTRKQQNML